MTQNHEEKPGKRKPKRKRGGQPGNRNAVRHGFYAKTLSRDEQALHYSIMEAGAHDPEIIRIRVKLDTLMKTDPANARAIHKAAWLMAERTANKNGLPRTQAFMVRDMIETVLKFQFSLVIPLTDLYDDENGEDEQNESSLF